MDRGNAVSVSCNQLRPARLCEYADVIGLVISRGPKNPGCNSADRIGSRWNDEFATPADAGHREGR
jgi:hypothetical protein